ncbi:MAG: TIGR03936 family radical SAM-associated protein [Pseudomonadota bacterium]
MKILSETKNRKERLNGLSKLNGVYVPSVHGDSHITEKALIKDLNSSHMINSPIIPYLGLIQDRLTYEIQRGCNRGCRLCQAGMIYRPVRQRRPQDILKQIEKDIRSTGYRDIGFLSLNACDYAPILRIITSLNDRFKNAGIYLSLPSLRIESISRDFLNMFSNLPKVGFTIAPEAGSEKLRKVINKDISEDEILNTVDTISGLGWKNVKTYFMTGLPYEDESDIEAIIELSYKMLNKFKGHGTRLIVSVSNFVPKPHTPFQWEEQLNSELFGEKISMLTRKLRHKNMSLKWGDPKMSEIEGVLARGDKKTGALIYSVYKKGEIFSAWGNEFKYESWMDSMDELGMNKDEYLSGRDVKTKLPWNNISTGIDPSWLVAEKERSFNGTETGHCTFGECTACGVCGKFDVRNIVVQTYEPKADETFIKKEDGKKRKLRCLYRKVGKYRWMGHFELMNAVEKAIIRAGVPIAISHGLKPSCELSFSPPVGLGFESCAELVDVVIHGDMPAENFVNSVNLELPEELRFRKAWDTPLSLSSLYQDISSASWDVSAPGAKVPESSSILGKVIQTERKGKKRTINTDDFVKNFNVLGTKNGVQIEFETLFMDGKTVKPLDVVKILFPDIKDEGLSVVRKGVKLNGIYFGD